MPGSRACSSDLVYASDGSNQTSVPDAAARVTASAETASATVRSVDTGRCGPWGSIAPVGSTSTLSFERTVGTSAVVRSAKRRDALITSTSRG